MIQITAFANGRWIHPDSLEALDMEGFQCCWVDFAHPTSQEVEYLDNYFHFHPLAIEDCLHWLQRPKVDFYEEYSFFVLHAMNKESLSPDEVNLFVADRFVVTYHEKDELEELAFVRETIKEEGAPAWKEGNMYVAYLIMDTIVDGYFPAVFELEDRLKEFDDLDRQKNGKDQIQMLYTVRGDLFKLRRTVHGMSDMLYRMLHTSHAKRFSENQWYFDNIYDHLIKIGETIDANREMTSDIRDSLISLHADRMNSVMTLLTVITTIFIPLTFITGIYGMNFRNMPETQHPYGYFFILGIMFIGGFAMYKWFKKKGWFNF
ncbi:magnesium/cobalt transporter CorA [Alkalibacter rhizosphaerae]|uniref:Magnesium transport protein CorA n=1 Tax=Alkalibacter rhizosphaerae TaxID=2815577 RepID=A0A975AHY1_9FIRM|nr:magnesium/cobalt transporter CorA [Alkalibacter rhizosphaerae]QSX07960.1 magnesium/cobalt transporter CorA [Alkalibacter rhizosphaerae]